MKKKSTKKAAASGFAEKAARAVVSPKPRRRTLRDSEIGLDAFYAAREEGFVYSSEYMDRLRSKAN